MLRLKGALLVVCRVFFSSFFTSLDFIMLYIYYISSISVFSSFTSLL